MFVDRCICKEVPFSRLLRLHREEGCGLEELRRRTAAGTGCGMCVPYIRLAIRTGRERVPLMHPDEAARMEAAAAEHRGASEED